MPICVLFFIWPRDPLYYQISLFLSIFWNFEADLRGFIDTLKMFRNTFLLKIYQKLPKNLTFTLICSDDQGGLVTPSDHCALSISNVKIQQQEDYLHFQHSTSTEKFKLKVFLLFAQPSLGHVALVSARAVCSSKVVIFCRWLLR